MMTVEFITALFYEVDEQLRAIPKRLCRKVAFETICAMVSPGDLRCTERESNDGD